MFHAFTLSTRQTFHQLRSLCGTVQKESTAKAQLWRSTASALNAASTKSSVPSLPDHHTLLGGFIRDPSERVHARQGNRRCGGFRPRASEMPGTMSHAIVARRGRRGPLKSASGTVRSVNGDDAPSLDCERGSVRLPFSDDRTLPVALETRQSTKTHPCAVPNTRSRSSYREVATTRLLRPPDSSAAVDARSGGRIGRCGKRCCRFTNLPLPIAAKMSSSRCSPMSYVVHLLRSAASFGAIRNEPV